MKKALLAAATLLCLGLLGLLAYVVHLVNSLNTNEFRQRVLAEVKARTGAEITAKEMSLDLLSGFTLRQATVGNPPPFRGNLLTAKAFILRYRLLPLLAGRVEVGELWLQAPVLTVATDAAGRTNIEKLGGAGSGGGASAAGAWPLALVLRRLAVTDASVRVDDSHGVSLLRLEDADLASTLQVAATGAEGRGRVKIARLAVGDRLFVSGLSAPLELGRGRAKLAPVRGRVAGGDVGANVELKLAGPLRWSADVELRRAQVAKLLEEARSKPSLTGLLAAKGRFEGGSGLPSVTGKGQASVGDCAVRDVPLLAVLASALGVPELARPDFDECRAEFTLRGSRLQTPVVSMRGPLLRLAGHGAADLASARLDYAMSLALAPSLLGRIPAKELRAAFEPQPDGFASLEFRVGGSFDQPTTDLASRVGKAAVGELLKSGLGRLFGRKKEPPPP